MFKILAIPNSSRDVPTFASIYKILEENNIKMEFISIDKYHKDNIDLELEKHSLNFKRIESYQTKNIHKIIIKEKPDLIFIASDYSIIGRTFILSAKKENIPVYLIITGNITRISNLSIKMKSNLFSTLIKQFRFHMKNYMFYIVTSFKLKKYLKIIVDPLVDIWRFVFKYDLRGCFSPDVILVSNYKSKELLIEKKIPPEKIKVVGDPRYDIKAIKEIDKTRYKKRSKVVFGTISAVEHGIWSKKQRQNFFQDVINTLIEFPDIEIIVSPHPQENLEVYESILSEMKLSKEIRKKIKIEKKKSTKYLLENEARIYISVISTTLNESILLNVPSITYNCFNNVEPYPYVEEKVVLKATNVKELRKNLTLLLKSDYYKNEVEPYRYQYIERNVTLMQKDSKSIILNLILSELKKKK